MWDADRKDYVCDDCGMIADPCVHEDDGRQFCEGCAPSTETPIEWLQSHLPTDETAERTMSRNDLRCIRQAIAGLLERDMWMPVLVRIADAVGDNIEAIGTPDYAAIVEDMKEALETIRAHFDGATEDPDQTAHTMRAIAHDVLWRNKLLPSEAK